MTLSETWRARQKPGRTPVRDDRRATTARDQRMVNARLPRPSRRAQQPAAEYKRPCRSNAATRELTNPSTTVGRCGGAYAAARSRGLPRRALRRSLRMCAAGHDLLRHTRRFFRAVIDTSPCVVSACHHPARSAVSPLLVPPRECTPHAGKLNGAATLLHRQHIPTSCARLIGIRHPPAASAAHSSFIRRRSGPTA
jgi:hypothetical protein